MKKICFLFLISILFVGCSKLHATRDGGSSEDGSGSSPFDEFITEYVVPNITLDDICKMDEYWVSGYYIYPNSSNITSNLLSGEDVAVQIKFDFDCDPVNKEEWGIPVLMDFHTKNGGELHAVGFFKDGMLRLAEATVIDNNQYDAVDYLRSMLCWFDDGVNTYGLPYFDYWDNGGADDEEIAKKKIIFEAKIDNWAHISGIAKIDGVGDDVVVELEHVASSDNGPEAPTVKYTSENGYELEMQYFKPFKGNKLNAKAIVTSKFYDGDITEGNIISVIDENETFDFAPEYCDFFGTGHWTKNKITIETPEGKTVEFTRHR